MDGNDSRRARAVGRMRELIVAGVSAGLRFWAIAIRKSWAALLAVSLAGAVAILAPPFAGLVAFALVGSGAIAELYTQAFNLRPGRYVRSRRLLGAWALAAVFMGVLGLLFFVVLLSTLYAVASAGQGFNPAQVATWAPAIDDRGRTVASLVFLLGILALGWSAMRVWLASAATVAEDRVAMLSTWPYTRGRVIPMAVARLILSAPALLLAGAVLVVGRAEKVSSLILALIMPSLVAFFWLPGQIGAEAEYYRRRVLPPEPAR